MRLLLTFLLCLFLAAPAFAQAKSEPKELGAFGGWKAYAYDQGGQPVCYMVLTAKFAPNKKLRRGMAYLMITHRPSEGSKDVVSYASGYHFKSTSEASAEVGKKPFDLFTQGDTAWSHDAATDRALALAIRANASFKFTGTPAAKGVAATTDTIALKGSDAAYKAISEACGVAVEPLPAPPKAAPKKHK